MKKTIYKITNLVNGKMYVGQTNDYERRKREHENQGYGRVQKVLYDAIAKYGWENFKMEKLEEEVENYNEREQYWINELNTLTPNGYNIRLEEVESSENLYITEEMFSQIIKDLEDSELSFDEIAKKYNIKSSQSIRDLNQGITHKHANIIYPIRKQRNDLARERAMQVIQDLKTTNLSMNELAKKYNCTQVTISNINTGSRCKVEGENYPIRSNTRKGQKFTEEIIDQMYEDILHSGLKWTELAEKYNCGTKVFQHINQGQIHRREGYTYPLRKEKTRKSNPYIKEIIELLKNSSLSYVEIAKKFNLSDTTIRDINKGRTNKQENMSYPIRQ